MVEVARIGRRGRLWPFCPTGHAGSNPVLRSKTLQHRRVFCWSPGGGIGRHAGLKILWTAMSVPVRSRPGAPEARLPEAGFFVHFSVDNP